MSDINSMFTDLFEKYYDPLMHYCTAKKIRRYDSEDIVSEAYERALSKSWQLSFLNENQQKTWLYTAVSLIIKEKAAKNGQAVFRDLDLFGDYVQKINVIDEFHEAEAFDTWLCEIKGSLCSDKERELFELIFDEKINYEALSEKYGISQEACRVKVSRFRHKLRKITDRIMGEEQLKKTG